MEIQFGPNSVEEPNLLYKLQRKFKVFNTTNPLPNRGYNLIASSSKYGLVFITTPEGMLCVYYLKQLIDKECEPQHLVIPLPIHPTHIAVNCNQEWLAIISGPLLLVYKCLGFQNQDIRPTVTMQLEVAPSTLVSSLQWNPCIADTIGIVFVDGTLLVSQVSTMQVKKIQADARCLCWSPKGKQLVTGNSNGTLKQYKPDLTLMKTFPAPNLFENFSPEVLAIHWIATFQFVVTYRNASDNSRPAVALVNIIKGGTPTCFNYEDICYSIGSNRPWYYYLLGLAQWNIILAASSNSMEIATLASTDGANWVQWCQLDEARPELPLTDKNQENYPVGICIDTAAVHQLPWGENEVLPPMPLLHVLSQTGLLSIFNIINLNKQSPQVCTPIQALELPVQALTRDVPGQVPQPAASEAVPVQQPKPVPQPVKTLQPQPVQQQPQPVQPQPQQTAVLQQATKPIQPQPMQPMQQQIITPKPQIPQSASMPVANVSFGAKKEATATVSESQSSEQTQKQSQIQVPKAQTTSPAVNAALKQEEERINKAKAEQELKNMLLKEINDFQMELYKFMKSTWEKQEKFERELQSVDLNLNIDMDPETLKKECEIEDLCETITQLKLDLVRACAVVAESRAHAEANEQRDWRQADPLTTKRLSSIKKMVYYVQNQLDQARKALELKWNDVSLRDQHSKPGERMIRPILDDVYQPLVKQQEILCRQQAVLKTLKNTLNECNQTPVVKSKSLLRSTPFRNKDPLSKLTKNILNMSIEPNNKTDEQPLGAQKLDALRDLLSNHKPIKIKPVNVELRQHLETLRKRYEKSLKEKSQVKKTDDIEKNEIKKDIAVPQPKIGESVIQTSKPPVHVEPKLVFGHNLFMQNAAQGIDCKKESNMPFKEKFGGSTFSFTQTKPEAPKPDVVKESPISIPTFTPSNMKPKPTVQSVARTLFTDEPKEEKQVTGQPSQVIKPDQQANASQYTKTLLRKMILKESETENAQEQKVVEQKNDANTFMGQNICSPTAFTFSKPSSTAPPTVFSKPIADMTSMFNKLEQTVPKQSEETGEPETRSPKPKEDKPMTNIFSMKPLSNKNQNVPDLVKSPGFGKDDTKVEEKSKENSAQKPVESKNELKPAVAPMISKPPAQSVIVVDLKKPAAEVKVEKFTPAIFKTDEATASRPEITAKAEPIPTAVAEDSKPRSPAASEAKPVVGIEPKTKNKEADSEKPSDLTVTKSDTATVSTPVIISSIFSSPPNVTVTSSVVSSTSTSIFNTTTTQSTFGNKPSAFAPNTASSVFGSASASVFGTQAPSFGTANVFGTTATPTSTTQSIFGASTTTTSSIFGTTTTTQSLFGGTSSAQSIFSAAASKSLFGTTQPNANIFGATTQTTVFGSKPSVFSSTSFGSSTQASIFGAPTSQPSVFSTPATTQTSVFGTPTTTQTSVFGSPSTTQSSIFGAPTTQASVFGSPTTTQTSVFGTPTTQTSVFGSSNASQTSVFGSPTTTQSSLFGGAESNLFAAASISTTSAPSQASGGNIFGSSPGSVFSSNTSNVFGKPAFGSSTFGQKPATDFWSGGDKTNSAFGTSTFGQQPTTQSSIFGTGTFSAPATGSPFTPGPFNGEKPSVFGTPNQQSAPAFGGSPVFGSKPVFGGSPNFGASTFGSGFNKSPGSGFGAPASFGGGFGSTAFGGSSPGKMFGNANTGFGSPSQQSNSTFENLASQNTLTFGNLAQQSGQSATQPPSFNTSPSFTGWRG
ncbi:nuclear pore complex protein Nup214-like [Danaus plexippus]|uniref:nuclear pore complex protein Nup214-like n=1 Tax=Danaus plexippus TaxID=13037 RepID=UPI002AB28432|nr:nuclear pore complex protein Nup214-like [Danaus plexippus]XP_061377201.1 nuclear pore complex protein Nup214-like [Danaus plexippus]